MPWWTLAISAVSVAAFFIPGAFEAMTFDRALLASEPWRVWTGHLAHGNLSHLGWSVITFLILGVRVEPIMGRRYPLFLAGSATVVGAAVLWLLPDVGRYCGISGLDTALYAYLMLADGARGWRERDRILMSLTVACAVALVVKIGYEYATGQMLFATAQGMTPVPTAHVIGSLAGMLAWSLVLYDPETCERH
ncbi:rhombosortase [Elusimicrobiota bacterium]